MLVARTAPIIQVVASVLLLVNLTNDDLAMLCRW